MSGGAGTAHTEASLSRIPRQTPARSAQPVRGSCFSGRHRHQKKEASRRTPLWGGGAVLSGVQKMHAAVVVAQCQQVMSRGLVGLLHAAVHKSHVAAAWPV